MALIKNRTVARSVVNLNLFKPGKVVEALAEGLGNPNFQIGQSIRPKINFEVHKRLKNKYLNIDGQPNPTFTVFDTISNNLVFTQTWIDFLIEKVKQE